MYSLIDISTNDFEACKVETMPNSCVIDSDLILSDHNVNHNCIHVQPCFDSTCVSINDNLLNTVHNDGNGPLMPCVIDSSVILILV
jgi:hypothetical protein